MTARSHKPAVLWSSALLGTALLLGGCGSGEHHTSVPTLEAVPGSIPPRQIRTHAKARPRPARPRRAIKPGRQLLFAFPKMGRLTADCRGDEKFRLTYTAGSEISERVVVAVNGIVVARRILDPNRSARFTVAVERRVQGSGTVFESPRIKLSTRVNRKPYNARTVARFMLADSADQSGECLAESASVKASTHFHYG